VKKLGETVVPSSALFKIVTEDKAVAADRHPVTA